MIATDTTAILKSNTNTHLGGLGGLGMAPGDPSGCYDPNRGSWIPYWWDTPTESDCKFHVDSIFAAIPGAAAELGTAAGQAVGGVIGGAASGAVSGAAAPIFQSAGTVMTLLLALVGFVIVKEIVN